MNLPTFQAKWRQAAAGLSERSAAQQHFLDLCALIGVPTPAADDPTGERYTFEKGAEKSTGGKGFADVWRRGYFGWEYKGRHADLAAAYRQLQLYQDALENPPLLVVCDLNRFEIRTHYTATPTVTHTFDLDGLSDGANLDVLRAVFTEPERLRPRQSTAAVTEAAAHRFGELARSLHTRGYPPDQVAHFLVQVLFCLFAEDGGLLPRGLFTDLLKYAADHPDDFPTQMTSLLTAMRDGGSVAFKRIDRFNGGLFQSVTVLPLTRDELRTLSQASSLDWGAVEPAIFGTLFERGLDPAQRSALGAHYTGRADIERVVDPVVMTPLRRRWETVRGEADDLHDRAEAATNPGTRTTLRNQFRAKLTAFQEELRTIRILDPACGSGNFLYVALARLLDLEKDVIVYGTARGLPLGTPLVQPTQLVGLEVNPYARELAQVVIWIGYLQWKRENGFPGYGDPILDPLETIELRDALIVRPDSQQPKADEPEALSAQRSANNGAMLADTVGAPLAAPIAPPPHRPTVPAAYEATWPAADFIIGNPPFLGGKRIRLELGDSYVDDLFHVYDRRVARESDLVCYFFEKARAEIAHGRVKRAGLLATNSIRGGANRRVLEQIKQSGDIFMAWDDEPWILNGAAVRISIVGFDDGSDTDRCLDGSPIAAISPSLSPSVDITGARRFKSNSGIAFMGVTPAGPFDLSGSVARSMLVAALNPNGRPNSDVVRPYFNGMDLTRRVRDQWIIDFGVDMPLEEAALYEVPFEYVRQHVAPIRATNKREAYRQRWWIHAEARAGMRRAFEPLTRYIATSMVSKHRFFCWLEKQVLPANLLIVFARDDDYFFGVLHSRAHERWSLRMGTWLGKGNDPRYTPTTCFETFPFPWPPGHEPEDDRRVVAIATAAKRLDDLRRNWLDPDGATEADLKKRTLTNLYNARPAWLLHAHAALDRAVWDAYGWPADEVPSDVPEDTILARLLALNLERTAAEAASTGRDV